MDAGRLAVVSAYCTRYRIERAALDEVFAFMTDDEALSKDICIHGTPAPAHIKAAWNVVSERLRRRREAEILAQRSSVNSDEGDYTRVPQATESQYVPDRHGKLKKVVRHSGRDENTRRLQEGTALDGPVGSKEYLGQWNRDFYPRSYIQAMQEKARRDIGKDQ